MVLLASCKVVTPVGVDSMHVRSQEYFKTAAVDRFGHLYYATRQNRVIKLNEHGDSLGYYENNSLGNIGLIDATNPLKVLIYYPDFYSGVVLDRLLNETQQFNMLELGYGEIRLIGTSIDGAMWIFDDHQQRLIKATENGQILQRGEDLRLRFNERLLPSKILQAEGEVYLAIPNRGLLIFDQFGQYQSQILQPTLIDFQIFGDQVILHHEEGFDLYDPRNPAEMSRIHPAVTNQLKLLF